MSAPDTNVEKQAKRHRPALIGLALAAGFAVILFLGYTVLIVERGTPPEGAETQIDGRTGTVSTE